MIADGELVVNLVPVRRVSLVELAVVDGGLQ